MIIGKKGCEESHPGFSKWDDRAGTAGLNHLEEGVQCLEWSRALHANRELFVSTTEVEAGSHPVALTTEQPSLCSSPFQAALSGRAWMFV